MLQPRGAGQVPESLLDVLPAVVGHVVPSIGRHLKTPIFDPYLFEIPVDDDPGGPVSQEPGAGECVQVSSKKCVITCDIISVMTSVMSVKNKCHVSCVT